MHDALSRIEAAATFLVEAKAARALPADDVQEAVRASETSPPLRLDWSEKIDHAEAGLKDIASAAHRDRSQKPIKLPRRSSGTE
jgi:hypothetical protein